MINFFTFKWGNKYNHLYVNRLFNSIKKYCNNKFNFFCITDNCENILPEITILDYKDFSLFKKYPKDRLFTREKSVLFKFFTKGKNICLDLDILIHNSLDFINYPIIKPTYIWNYWVWDLHKTKESAFKDFGALNNVYINGSFVAWQDNNAEHIFDKLYNKQKYAFYMYNSFDRYLFYQHWRNNDLNFWPKEFFYTYNFELKPRTYQHKSIACLFNNSHGTGWDLHETNDWAKKLWTSYD